MIDGQTNRRSDLQVELIEESRRDDQHDRATDLAQIGCVHNDNAPPSSVALYLSIICLTAFDKPHVSENTCFPTGFELCYLTLHNIHSTKLSQALFP